MLLSCATLLVQQAQAYHAMQPEDRHVLIGSLPARKETMRKHSGRKSVAHNVESQAAKGVTIKYLTAFEGRPGDLRKSFIATRRKMTDGDEQDDESFWDQKDGKWEYGKFDDGEWTVDKTAGDRPPWLKKDGADEADDEYTAGGIRRCGFNWDDAAAKVGSKCSKDDDCWRPKDAGANWPIDANYSCYADMPDYQRGEMGECQSADSSATSDVYCQQVCGAYPGAWCDPAKCDCIKNSMAWNLSAPIQALPEHGSAKSLPEKSKANMAEVAKEWDDMPSGLPSCRWNPHKGCTNVTQYECFEGKAAGKCSGDNWYLASDCTRSCVHVRLLKPAPYYALWIPGPEGRDFGAGERQPRYVHDPKLITPEARGIHLKASDVLMSNMCHSDMNKFVGITLYSPHYEDKASRLIRSCERVGICCKATLLPSNAFGAASPEGSEEFRFATIAMKPSFILSQLESTDLPVVFLDTDLEFHRYPNLFLPGSWPDYDRDVLLFNYWANETSPETKNTPNIGSAVAYFNATMRAKAILRGWAQAMAYDTNQRAPDDQVLDLLLGEGEWLKRASFGWIPSSYLRTMPAYYRGVVPVIDHDHGSAPGIIKHSEAKPIYPPTLDMELCDPTDHENAGRSMHLSTDDAKLEAEDDKQKAYLCEVHGQCGQPAWSPDTPDLTDVAGAAAATTLDPNSAEYLCQVHGQCEGKDESAKTNAIPAAPVPVTAAPVPAPAAVAAAPSTPVPQAAQLDPNTPEYACQVHGQCDKDGKPLPTASPVAVPAAPVAPVAPEVPAPVAAPVAAVPAAAQVSDAAKAAQAATDAAIAADAAAAKAATDADAAARGKPTKP